MKKKTQDAIKEGLRWNRNLKREYRATSTYSEYYAAEKAEKIQNNYWCSAKGDDAPIYWRIFFPEMTVQIVKVEFEEKYPGAEFEFFASNDAQNCNADEVLIRGNQEDINGIKFENDKSYPCYGLKITRLANTNSNGPLATVNNFFLGDCDENWVSGRNSNGCEEYGDPNNNWCKKDGDHYGSAWKKNWGKFEDWADSRGRTALVCPQCGCIDESVEAKMRD